MKIISVVFLLAVAIAPLAAAQKNFSTHEIEQITGLKGAWNEAEKVFKISAPRTDVKAAHEVSPMNGGIVH